MTLLIALFFSCLAKAGIQIDTTRVVFPAQQREVFFSLSNRGDSPALVQVWIDQGDFDSKQEDADAPFIANPPIFRLDGKKGKSVGLMFTGESLPQDRESLFWLNVLEIPHMPKDANSNFMQFAVRSRLKLFYRPEILSGDISEEIKKVNWTIVSLSNGNYALRGENTGPYYLSYNKLELIQNDKKIDLGGGMINPFEKRDFTSKIPIKINNQSKIRYQWMSDYGVSPEEEQFIKHK